MRIIAGRHRSRRLLGPADERKTRPITDRVKQSLFDRLASDDRLDGAVVLDLFAGTGSMGLECLSRDAVFVCFVERDGDAIRRLLKNLESIGQAQDARVLNRDALSAGLMDAIGDRRFTLVFVDPPYATMRDRKQVGRLRAQITRLADACAENAMLVLRTEQHETVEAIEGWTGPDSHVIGSMTLHFFVRE